MQFSSAADLAACFCCCEKEDGSGSKSDWMDLLAGSETAAEILSVDPKLLATAVDVVGI